ncbi:uncharacterized protein J3D65DRAFT_356964 [Phyllosticta citribraziliensis]|uniref:Uncharacterized protein n=1 Tax=Phyllosticta citribraziliensis TaxID=989973 RepID=A0ABR1LP07_9PEZI
MRRMKKQRRRKREAGDTKSGEQQKSRVLMQQALHNTATAVQCSAHREPIPPCETPRTGTHRSTQRKSSRTSTSITSAWVHRRCGSAAQLQVPPVRQRFQRQRARRAARVHGRPTPPPHDMHSDAARRPDPNSKIARPRITDHRRELVVGSAQSLFLAARLCPLKTSVRPLNPFRTSTGKERNPILASDFKLPVTSLTSGVP